MMPVFWQQRMSGRSAPGPAPDRKPEKAPAPVHNVSNHATERKLRRRLKLSRPQEPAEIEADRMADTALRPPGPAPLPIAAVPGACVQRKCAECEEEEQEEIQRKAVDGAPAHETAGIEPPPGGLGAGEPLPGHLRAFFEPRFGHDFSQVRIHTDSRASQAARAVNALAYTVGADVVFGSGQYQPASSEGRRLLAHELTHVVQQGQGGTSIPMPAPDSAPEREADRAGREAGETARPVHVAIQTGLGVMRQEQSPDELRKRLEQVRRDLGTGTGVRSPQAAASLRDEEQRLSAALAQAETQELQRQLKANQQRQSVGSGVRSPRASAELKEEEDRLKDQMAMAAAGRMGTAALVRNPPAAGSGALFIDWGGGNLRGLAAEDQVIATAYPGALRLPRGYPGVDFVMGGQRTPLTGLARGQAGKLPLSPESVFVEGGTLIQLKTMKNSLPYYQEPNTMYKTLEKGMKDLANIKPGTGKSEQVGSQYFRVEHSGEAGKKILHVELEVAPSPEQMAQLERLREDGKSFGQFGPGEEIEVVVNWPGRGQSPFRVTAGGALTAANVALAVAGNVGREQLRERQLKTEGYAPTGLAAHQTDSFLVQLGAFFRGDQAETLTGAVGTLDMPVWRANVRKAAEARKPGETLTINWQYSKRAFGGSIENEDVPVVYEKQPDGSWRAQTLSDIPEGFRLPDLNKVLDPKESDSSVKDMLSTEKGA